MNLLYIIESYIHQNFSSFNFSILTKSEAIDLILTTCTLIIEYLSTNLLEFNYTDKLDDLYANIQELYEIQFYDLKNQQNKHNLSDINICNCDIINYDILNVDINELNNDITNVIWLSNKLIYKFVVPPRSYKTSFIRIKQSQYKKRSIEKKIRHLKAIPQPAQRTPEWYKFRQETLTASNIWKIFGSEATQNQLIYEKCKPSNNCVDISQNTTQHVNITSPLHWGNKYEPLSILYYEHTYNTKIDDFGCIPHHSINHIAASPDGINCLPESDRYGRMLEIKNIVNRDITGIPKMEYWIQMQIQMETCNLNECDFLETRFKEYENYESFINDPDFINDPNNLDFKEKQDCQDKYRGIILHFEKDGVPFYEYHKFGLHINEILEWEHEQMEKYSDITWVKTDYWKLDEVSCVLVLRNKLWFQKAEPYIKLLWDIITIEKSLGSDHRAPKSRNKKNNNINNQNNEGDQDNLIIKSKCLIQL